MIVGMPRAATAWLCKSLNEHPEVAAFGESLYWGRRYIEPRGFGGTYTPEQVQQLADRLRSGSCIHDVSGEGSGNLRNISKENFESVVDAVLARLGDSPTPGELFIALCDVIAEAEGKRIGIEKTPHHINWIDRITGALPNAKFAIMLREPYSFMLSYKHQGDRKREFVRKQFRRRYHPLACAVVWRGCMKAAIGVAKHDPDRALMIEHNDLRSDPAAQLERVRSFFELPPPALPGTIPMANSSFPDGTRPELRADDIFWMNRIAGRLLIQAGYRRQPTPRNAAAVAFICWSILRLPLWAILNLFSLKRRTSGSIFVYLRRWLKPAAARPAASAPS